MLSKYPHTGTVSYVGLGTYNTVGVWTPGTLTTVGIVCDIQPVSGRFIIGEGGAAVGYNWHILSPLFSSSASIPKKAKLAFFSADHIIEEIFTYQRHVEMKCRD